MSDEAEALKKILRGIHEALGEAPESDDDSLPEVIAGIMRDMRLLDERRESLRAQARSCADGQADAIARAEGAEVQADHLRAQLAEAVEREKAAEARVEELAARVQGYEEADRIWREEFDRETIARPEARTPEPSDDIQAGVPGPEDFRLSDFTQPSLTSLRCARCGYLSDHFAHKEPYGLKRNWQGSSVNGGWISLTTHLFEPKP